MNVFREFLEHVCAALEAMRQAGELPADVGFEAVTLEPPRDPAHGHMATNAALVLAKAARRKPLDLAAALAARLRDLPEVVDVGVAPPGFVNLRLADDVWRRQIRVALEYGPDYGRCNIGQGLRVNVEYCSANPTGPLHVGHGRGTVFGDALANVLEFAGYRVTREYYINDGGAQIEALARSIYHRYLELFGLAEGPLPEGLYPLEELIPVAQAIAERDGRKWVGKPEADWLDLFGRAGVEAMMARIREDLALLGVHHDVFTSERALIEAGRIEETIRHLERLGLIYVGTLPPPKGKPVEDWEPVPQLLFRASAFGDDSDRPLRRSNGAWTYFAADVAYHLDKIRRGAQLLIDVWSADHGGYVRRMQAAVKALSEGRVDLVVRLCQLVKLYSAGQPLRMSKRAGRTVWLRDVLEEVGRDVFRFMMLTRRNDAPLDFDLVEALRQSRDNPVFYVQYAHARICSVFRNAIEAGLDPADCADAPLERLVDVAELDLLRVMAQWPRVVEGAAQQSEPHRIAFYLHDLAGAFHSLWTKGKEDTALRFLITDDEATTRARLAMLGAVRTVLANGLRLIGVEPGEELH
jgi:arginyl-tRNA synthetase